MRVQGSINRNVPLERVPDGSTRYALNMVKTKDGKLQNEDGLITDPDKSYDNTIGGIVELEQDTIVIFPQRTTGDSQNEQATVQTKGMPNRTFRIPKLVSRANFSYATFQNYLKERIIVYTDVDNSLRVVNIDQDLGLTGFATSQENFEKLTKLTPDLYTPNIQNIRKIDGGQLKSGSYYVSYGYELEQDSVSKWTVPAGPFNVTSYGNDIYASHTGAIDGITKQSLEITINGHSSRYAMLNIAIISNINGVLSARIVKKVDMRPANNITFVYSGNELVRDIAPEEILVNKLHIEKAASVTRVQDSVVAGGINTLGHALDTELQEVANNITVNYKISEVPETTAVNDDYQDVTIVNSSAGESRQESLMPDEVYAHYWNVQLIDGTSRQFLIQGREAQPISIPMNVYNDAGDSAYFNLINNEDDPVPTAILDHDFYNQVPKTAMAYQLVNTCEYLTGNDNDDDGFIPGYWSNRNERFPDHAKFGSVRNELIRHHRCPSYKQGYDLFGFAFKINSTYTNIAVSAELAAIISNQYFSCAKRTTSNSLINGMTGLNPEAHTMTISGGVATGLYGSPSVRGYDYNLLSKKISPTFNHFKIIYGHSSINGSEPRLDYTSTVSSTIEMFNNSECRFRSLKVKKYLPEGNAATDPPNIFDYNNEITNREEAMYFETDKRMDFFITRAAHDNFVKPMVLLYNWSDDLYIGATDADTFIVTDPHPTLSLTRVVGTGGDVYNGVEHVKLTNAFFTLVEEVKDYIMTWFGFSPILQQSRVVDPTDEDNVIFTYNKGNTGINDYHTPFKLGANLDDDDIAELPYRFVKSNVQQTESVSLNIRDFLVNVYGDIPKYKGVITNLIGQGNNLFVQTNHTTWIYKIKDTLKTDEINAYLGRSDLFDIQAQELIFGKLSIGGNAHVGSHLQFRHGVLYPDAVGGNLFLFRDSIKNIADIGLSNDIKNYLKGATEVHLGYDDNLDRVMVSIINPSNTVTPAILLSYYPSLDYWVSAHTHTGVKPFSFDGSIQYANINTTVVGNRLYKHDPLASSLDLVGFDPRDPALRHFHERDAHIDVVIGSPSTAPVAMNTVYFKTICESLLEDNNKYISDTTFDEIMCYTRTKCTGVRNLMDNRSHKTRLGGFSSYKHGIWRFNDIKDMIVHYNSNLLDRPYFINEDNGVYNPEILSRDAGGTRPSLPAYDRKVIIESYIVVRFIMRTTLRRKISLTDVALSMTNLTPNT